MGQFILLQKESLRFEARQIVTNANVMRVAMNGNRSEFERFVGPLRDTEGLSEGKSEKVVLTPEDAQMFGLGMKEK